MTNHNFKPGDVALVEAGCWANRKVALRLGEGWSHTNGVNVDGDGIISVVRPLVVIDPEDREQVERLADTMWHLGLLGTGVGVGKTASAAECSSLAEALREFANPKPPKPDEPTGKYAVVVDGVGDEWVRLLLLSDGVADAWVRSGSLPSAGRWTTYADIDAVRVLSDGVQS